MTEIVYKNVVVKHATVQQKHQQELAKALIKIDASLSSIEIRQIASTKDYKIKIEDWRVEKLETALNKLDCKYIKITKKIPYFVSNLPKNLDCEELNEIFREQFPHAIVKPFKSKDPLIQNKGCGLLLVPPTISKEHDCFISLSKSKSPTESTMYQIPGLPRIFFRNWTQQKQKKRNLKICDTQDPMTNRNQKLSYAEKVKSETEINLKLQHLETSMAKQIKQNEIEIRNLKSKLEETAKICEAKYDSILTKIDENQTQAFQRIDTQISSIVDLLDSRLPQQPSKPKDMETRPKTPKRALSISPTTQVQTAKPRKKHKKNIDLGLHKIKDMSAFLNSVPTFVPENEKYDYLMTKHDDLPSEHFDSETE